MRVDQLVPAFHRGDAIGDEAWELRRSFRAEGRDGEIFCLSRDRGLDNDSRLLESFSRPSPSAASP